MLEKKMIKAGNERGNALFLILIAVALFAALSYAVTQSGRGGGTVDRETSMIAAGQMTQYPAAIRTAITRMVLTGTPVAGATGVTFATASGNSYEVFDAAGGGAAYVSPPANVGTASGEGGPGTTVGTLASNTWGFKGATSATLGYYIAGVGTDVDVSGREVFAYVHDISAAVCQQILKGLGLSTTPATQSTAVDYTVGTGLGVATEGAHVIGTGSNNAVSAISGQAFACFRNGATLYDYYHALVEQ